MGVAEGQTALQTLSDLVDVVRSSSQHGLLQNLVQIMLPTLRDLPGFLTYALLSFG